MRLGDGTTTTAVVTTAPPRFTTRLWSRADAFAARLPLWPTLAVVSLVTLLAQIPAPHASAWHWFDDAGSLLLGDGPAGTAGGLHLYRDNPDFQFGPLSIAIAAPLTLLGTDLGSWVAMVVASAAGLGALALLLDAAEQLQPGLRRHVPPSAVLAGGVITVVTWGDVAVRTAHIDDAIALVAIAAALRWCAQAVSGPPADNGHSAPGRGAAVTVALAIAVAAKPWAIMFAPLAFVPPIQPRWVRSRPVPGEAEDVMDGAEWARLARVGIVGALALLTWAPFILAEPQTLDTAGYGIVNEPTSVLRALGIDDPTTPGWARPAQLIGGTALVGVLVAREQWPLALLAGVAWRLFLDPAANRYYTIGLVLGALLVEVTTRRRPHRLGGLPWATLVAALILELTAIPGIPVLPARTLRLITVAVAFAFVAWLARGSRPWRRPKADATVPWVTGRGPSATSAAS